MNLKREYQDFEVTEEYIETLPDLQNGPSSLIKGANVSIEHVGIHNFKLPLTIPTKDGKEVVVEASITGTVSLEANKKGINMSRIMRNFYEYSNKTVTLDTLEEILNKKKEKLGSFDAHIFMSFSYPMLVQSLRSKLKGYQFYKTTLEVNLHKNDVIKRFIHLDFVYSSTCPCSTELSLHAMENRNILATPHSQRSIARVTVQFDDKQIWIEELIEKCREALKTEVQVLVKRETEQAFAELNGAYLKFVEDAVRLVYEQLIKDERILDFKVICVHCESLHAHDAIAVITKNVENGLQATFSQSEIHDIVLNSIM